MSSFSLSPRGIVPHRSRRRTLARALVPLVLIAVGRASPARGGGLDEEQLEHLDRAITEALRTRHVPGLSVAVGRDGEILWSRAYGAADLEHQVPAATTTLFRTASMGKPLTATAVLRLVERRVLDLDAPIREHCPGFPETHAVVTCRQLLSHTAGIRDKTPEEEFNVRHFDGPSRAIDVFKDDALLFEPGTGYRYTSYGYTLVGCAIEGATGSPYARVMHDEVFGPAGMVHTREDVAAEIVEGRARGYVLDASGELRNALHDDMSNRTAAGGFLSTAEDLVRFGMALSSGKLLSQESLRIMSTPRSDPEGKVLAPGASSAEGGYGLGWLVDGNDGDPLLLHGGSTPGFSGLLLVQPSKRLCIAFMTNLESMAGRSELAEQVRGIALR